MFEHRRQPLLPKVAFLLRLLRTGLTAILLIAVSLALGTFGYHRLEGLPWIDAALNAAMILTGMGPVSELHTRSGKLFATAYALFSGIVFLTAMVLLFAPVAHRVLHRFHLEMDMEEAEPQKQQSSDNGSDQRERGQT